MYEKQIWNTGDVITEEKLNHMEDGIASGGVFIVGSTYDESTETETLDKTYKEIVDAFNAGQNVILKYLDDDGITNINPLALYGSQNNMFGVIFYGFNNEEAVTFLTDSENGYPSHNENSGGGDPGIG